VLNFEGTSLVLVLGRRLIFGWYEANIYTLPLRFILSLNNPLNIYTFFFVKIRNRGVENKHNYSYDNIIVDNCR
jgi:hypothetical protein